MKGLKSMKGLKGLKGLKSLEGFGDKSMAEAAHCPCLSLRSLESR